MVKVNWVLAYQERRTKDKEKYNVFGYFKGKPTKRKIIKYIHYTGFGFLLDKKKYKIVLQGRGKGYTIQ